MIQLRPAPETVAPRLAALLKSPALPARAALAGQQLLQRLTSPIRVAILGHPGSGKSQLLNLIAGERLLPSGVPLPSVEVRFGPVRRVLLLGADESLREVPFAALGRLGREAAQMVRIEAPLPILSTLTLIEVSGAGTAGEERAAVQWAAARADMVIWCSQAFTAAERWLWSAMPDRLKDHGFLVLTKADELIRAGTFAAQMADLEEVVAQEFHSLVPVATLQGLAATTGEKGPDREALAASGAEALVAALLAHVEQGRRADLDAALLFLSRFGGAAAPLPETAVPAAEVPEAAAPETFVPEAAAEAPAEPPAPAAFYQAPAAAAEPPAAEIPALATPPAETSASEAPPSAAPAAETSVARALDLLRGAAGPLLARMEAAGHAEDILEGCAQAAQAAADTIDPAAQPRLHDEALEVTEMLVLLGLERSETAAADAVTLLLQLRRDLACAEAA